MNETHNELALHGEEGTNLIDVFKKSDIVVINQKNAVKKIRNRIILLNVVGSLLAICGTMSPPFLETDIYMVILFII